MADTPERSKNPVTRALRGQEPIMTAVVLVGGAAAGAHFGFDVPADQILAVMGVAGPATFYAAREKVVPAVDVAEVKNPKEEEKVVAKPAHTNLPPPPEPGYHSSRPSIESFPSRNIPPPPA